MKKIVLVGYSGHAYVVADVLMGIGYDIIGYFEKNKKVSNPFNLNYLGTENDNITLKHLNNDVCFFVAIGDNQLREEISKSLLLKGVNVAKVISPLANVSKLSNINDGVFISNGVCINAFAHIEYGSIINTGAVIEHECHIGNYSHIAPGAVILGKVNIGNNCFIGANSIIKQGVKIGNNVTIGAGAVVLKDVPNNVTLVGNPAKKIN
jgi:sugar O-acyltransferase (sialic acid O-acetyltransferase NeuD family)